MELPRRQRGGCSTIELGRVLAGFERARGRPAVLPVPHRRERVRTDLRPKGDVSDLVQETFLEAARDFGQFTGRTGPEWRSWLRRIFINNLQHLVRTYRRTIKRDVGVEVPSTR